MIWIRRRLAHSLNDLRALVEASVVDLPRAGGTGATLLSVTLFSHDSYTHVGQNNQSTLALDRDVVALLGQGGAHC